MKGEVVRKALRAFRDDETASPSRTTLGVNEVNTANGVSAPRASAVWPELVSRSGRECGTVSDTLEDTLHQRERTLIPRHPVVESRAFAFGFVVVFEIPLVGFDERLLVRIARLPPERFELLDRDIRVLVGSFVDPRIQRRE